VIKTASVVAPRVKQILSMSQNSFRKMFDKTDSHVSNIHYAIEES
jgi:hypothetical protein